MNALKCGGKYIKKFKQLTKETNKVKSEFVQFQVSGPVK